MNINRQRVKGKLPGKKVEMKLLFATSHRVFETPLKTSSRTNDLSVLRKANLKVIRHRQAAWFQHPPLHLPTLTVLTPVQGWFPMSVHHLRSILLNPPMPAMLQSRVGCSCMVDVLYCLWRNSLSFEIMTTCQRLVRPRTWSHPGESERQFTVHPTTDYIWTQLIQSKAMKVTCPLNPFQFRTV